MANVDDAFDRIMSEALEDSLGVGEAALASLDPTTLGRSLARAMLGAASRPWRLAPAAGHACIGAASAMGALAARSFGLPVDMPHRPDGGDRRFEDPAWRHDLRFQAVLQAYLIANRALVEMVEASPSPAASKEKARFGARLVGDALSPTNFLPTNPAAMRRAVSSGGASLLRGARNMLHDVRANGGWPLQVDTSGFRVGENLATTPGKVVYRNELIELIQYLPTTPEVHTRPLLMCPPWINRYYIMDLAPGRSLIQWAVDHGLTTFAMSYKSADSSMRDMGVDEYLLLGPRRALEVVREITGVDAVNILGVCMGGTLNAAMLAYGEAVGDPEVSSATFLNAAIDFTDAGLFGAVFADEHSIDELEERAGPAGFLSGRALAKSFDLMRANDLIFNCAVSRWLMGDDAPTLDLLAWNSDSTNMPVRMHGALLRACYQQNALAQGELQVAGARLDPSKIRTDSYIVAAVGDHLVPWQSSYRSTQLLGGEVRFVLSSAGHIAGIVNPPGPKTRLWTGATLPPTAPEWLAASTEASTTWWEDWITWVHGRSGPLGSPPPIGGDGFPVLCDAPGTYVLS